MTKPGMLDHTRIALLESRWRDDSNISMRNLFELIADIAANNPNSFHYEMASTPDAAREAILRIAGYPKCRYLCIGTHGNYKGLEFPNKALLARSSLRDILEKLESTPRKRLDGIYLSSCAFGGENLATFLYERKICPTWIAGYTNYINWIESSSLDLLFFNELMRVSVKDLTPIEQIQQVADRLMVLIPDLVRELGFGIYVRKRGNGGGSINLLARE